VTTTKDGAQVRLRDLADVQDVQKDVEKIARVDRRNALALQVIKQSDANAVEVSKNIRKILVDINKQYEKEGLNITIANDGSEYTLESANAVIIDLVLAIVLVAIIMLLFLHSFRNALIVMVAIPSSLVATFIGMYLLGFSLNLMSLIALSLVVGI